MTVNKQVSWFETWFDTPLYEKMYANRDMSEASALAKLISKHFPPDEYTRVIDIACGRGRHSFNLAKLGYNVTGVDLSERAIKRANTLKETFPFPDRVRFQEHDMRLPLNETYDLTVNLFTSFGYLPDDKGNRRIFDHIAGSVRDDGALVSDFLNPGFVESTLAEKETRETEDFDVIITRLIKDNAVNKTMRFVHKTTGDEQTFSEHVKLYDLEWFSEQAAEHGLKPESVYGDYNGEPYDKTTSPRMIMLFRKTGG
ncbi:MAG: methyltransferase domain-containing protein [Balneolia bacterium]|nr:methyltransferase domain-containing protein [Balneolia bacterium]